MRRQFAIRQTACRGFRQMPPAVVGCNPERRVDGTKILLQLRQCRESRRIAGIGENAVNCAGRSEEHTSELQSLMRISYAVFCLKKKKRKSLYIARTKDN